MFYKNLESYHFILASASPRRQELLKTLGLDFEIRLKPVKEIYPENLKYKDISNYLAELKASPFKDKLEDNDILITADTIVWHNGRALEKPVNADAAFKMLVSLSNATHEVITSVCFTTKNLQKTLYDITNVTFKPLTETEINYYIKTCKPFDKAGAYGIQEWIGHIGITKIEGSYYNVMGFPVHVVYDWLSKFLKTEQF